MKKIFAFLLIIGFIGNLNAMEPAYAEATAGRPALARHPSFLKKMTGLMEQKMVTVQTSDKQEFMIPVIEAQKIPTLNNMLGDIGEEQTMAIPLSNVDSVTFNYVLKLVNQKVNVDGIFVNRIIPISDQAEFHDRRLSPAQLIKLNNACEFLGLDNYLPQLINKLSESNLGNYYLGQLLPICLRGIWNLHPAHQSILDSIGVDVAGCAENVKTSPDNQVLVSWSNTTRKIRLWDLKNLYKKPHEVPHQPVREIQCDKDRLVILTGEKFKLWDMHNLDFPPRTLGVAANLPQTTDSYSHFHLDRNYILTINKIRNGKKVLNVWKAETPHNLVLKLKSTDQVFYTVDHDSQLISYSDNGSEIKIFDMDNPDQPPRELGPYEPIQSIKRVESSPDQSKLTLSNDHQIAVIDTQGRGAQPYTLLLYMDGRIDSVQMNCNINKLIAWDKKPGYGPNANSVIQIWDMNQLDNPPHTIRGLKSVVANPDSTKLVSWDSNVIKIFSLESPETKPHKLYPECNSNKRWHNVLISPNGKKLITVECRSSNFGIAPNSTILKVWNLENLSEQPQILHPVENPQNVIISADSTKLILKLSKSSQVWDIDACDQLQGLNHDQIQLMIWLYHRKNRDLQAAYSPELLTTYKSLSPKLKQGLHKSFAEEIKLFHPPSFKRKVWLAHRWTS